VVLEMMRRSLTVAWVQKRYSGIAASLLIIGIFYGYSGVGGFHHFLLTQLAAVQDKAKNIQAHHNVFYTMGQIFGNNFKVSLLMIVAGIFFGVVPYFFMFSNGALVGFLLNIVRAKTAVSPLLTFALGILPHGIFELSAMVIAAGAGIKIGTVILVPLRGYRRGASLAIACREAAYLIVLVACLLVVAAIVETTITPILLAKVLTIHGPIGP